MSFKDDFKASKIQQKSIDAISVYFDASIEARVLFLSSFASEKRKYNACH